MTDAPLSGRIGAGPTGDQFFSRRVQGDASGRIACEAPQGLRDARLLLVTYEHSALRSRISKDAPLSNGDKVELGTLDRDMTEIAIIRYTAPTLVVKAVDQDGKTIAEAEPKIEYAASRAPIQGGYSRNGKPAGDVSFQPQNDGRWRTEQLLPDEDITLTVEAAGYPPSSQKLLLSEGATKELEVWLQKVTNDTPAAGQADSAAQSM